MKIVSNTSDAQAAPSAPTHPPKDVVAPFVPAMSPPADEVRPPLESARLQLLSEMQVLQEKFEHVRTRLTEQLLQNTRQVAKLSEEVLTLRDVMEHMHIEKPVEPPVLKPVEPPAPQPITQAPPVVPVVIPLPETPSNFKAAPLPEKINVVSEPKPMDFSVLPMDYIPERKVAFLTKLWDYLNHVAIEIPLHKKNRSN